MISANGMSRLRAGEDARVGGDRSDVLEDELGTNGFAGPGFAGDDDALGLALFRQTAVHPGRMVCTAVAARVSVSSVPGTNNTCAQTCNCHSHQKEQSRTVQPKRRYEAAERPCPNQQRTDRA